MANKAEHKFHRDKRETIDNQSRESTGPLWAWRGPANRPIFIPKKKKR